MAFILSISLDYQNYKRLKEVQNRSKLVNDLLSKYFNTIDLNEMSKEELLLELEKNKIKKEAEEKIKGLQGGYQ